MIALFYWPNGDVLGDKNGCFAGDYHTILLITLQVFGLHLYTLRNARVYQLIDYREDDIKVKGLRVKG